MLHILPPTIQTCLATNQAVVSQPATTWFVLWRQVWFVGGKTRNIAIQLFLQPCCKTSCNVFVALFYRSLKANVTYSSQLHHQLWQLQYDQHVSNELYATCCRLVWRSLSPTLLPLFRIWKKTKAMFQPKATCRAAPGSNGRREFSVAAPVFWNSLPQHIRDAG